MAGAVASDIQKGVSDTLRVTVSRLTRIIDFWNLGHELFISNPKTFPVPFITGNVFDPSNLEPVTPFNDPPKTPMPALNTLISLNPLRGHVSVIHASSFFHLFDEEKQFRLAQALAGLLSPSPGSVIFGSHSGQPVKGIRQSQMPGLLGGTRFCHSPESWKELWDGQIFERGRVMVEAVLRKFDRTEPSMPNWGSSIHFWLIWSVTRI